MTARCPRAWEIESAHDGRVSGSALQALRQHLDGCEFCSREYAYFESLTRALSGADVASEELTARRMRPIMLSRARAARYQRPSWPLMAALSAVVLSVALLSAQWLRPPWQPPASSPVVALAASTATLTAVAPADCIVRGSASDDAVMPQLSRLKVRATSSRARPRMGEGPAHHHQAHADAREIGADGSAAEDAAYLSIIALSREGRSEEARIAARAYLTSFPNGFRRPEAERLAGLH